MNILAIRSSLQLVSPRGIYTGRRWGGGTFIPNDFSELVANFEIDERLLPFRRLCETSFELQISNGRKRFSLFQTFRGRTQKVDNVTANNRFPIRPIDVPNTELSLFLSACVSPSGEVEQVSLAAEGDPGRMALDLNCAFISYNYYFGSEAVRWERVGEPEITLRRKYRFGLVA